MSSRERRRKAKRMGKRTAAGAGAVLGATLVATGGAQAADFTVTNLDASGAGSLRDAIDQANLNAGPDRVLFQSGLSGTIHLNDPVSTGPLYISEALEVQGPGADVLTVSGDDDSQVFFVSAPGGDDVTISGLKVTQGTAKYGGPGAPAGGDIASPNGADLTVSASEIRGGVGIVGGGIYSDGPLTVQNSTVSGNVANFLGGGVFVTGYGTGPEPPLVSISGSTINNNSVGAKYGGFFTAQATEPSSREGGGGGAALRGNVVIE